MMKSIKVASAMIFVACVFSAGNSFAIKHIINVQNFSFSPSNITDVEVGDTIMWVWVSGTHTTTSTTIPLGATAWNSPITSAVPSFEYKVTIAGVYNYKCTPHASMGMVGAFTATAPAATLNVTPPNQNVAAGAASTAFSVLSNSNWTASSDATWCSVTPSGSGNGTITAVCAANPTNVIRVASITVTVAGLTPQVVTVTQQLSTVSVSEIPGSDIKIYPNPSKGNFFISLGNLAGHEAKVTILSENGSVVMTRNIVTNEDSNFNMQSLPAGTYFIRIKTELGTKTERLLITG